MTFSQFVALLAFLTTALPLGAIATIALLYTAVAAGKAPGEAAMLFERLAGRAYCWTMIGFMGLGFLLIGGWTARLLLFAVAASFLRAILDILPRLESLHDSGMVVEPDGAARLARWRIIVAAASAAQWLAVLIVYVRLVL